MTHVTTRDYNSAMIAVGIRDLKARLSEYLRRVRSGELVLVTDRGEVVAELRRPSSVSDDFPYPRLIEMVRQGEARLGKPNNPDLYASRPTKRERGTAAGLLDRERGDR